MTYENFKHVDPDEYHDRELTLHDCIADKITFKNNTLSFCLPDGLWITPHHKDNTTENIVRTDTSAVSFSVEDVGEITVRVFIRNIWCRSKKLRVEDWSIEQLVALVNSEKCTLEFITQYRSHYEQMWHCVIRSKKKPYYMECQLYLPATKATFFWNELRPDRKW